MMRIPGFQNAIFPAASMPNLTLAANIGLILFLFVVGLEVNIRLFVANWRVALRYAEPHFNLEALKAYFPSRTSQGAAAT